MSANNIRTRLFYDGAWQATPSYERVDIKSTWGLQDEGSAIGVSSCTLQLNNRSGDYAPSDARSNLFGRISRNTPGRVYLLPGFSSGDMLDTSDAFGRTVASGWGSSDQGGTWSLAGLGGTVQTSDWAVGSGVGTVGVPDVATAYRESYLTDVNVRDVEVALTFKVAQATGGDLEPAGIIFRGGSSGYFLVRFCVTSTNSVVIRVLARGDEVIGEATVAGLTHTGTGQPIRVRALAAGNRFHARAWVAANTEPDEWDLVVFDTSVDSSEVPIPGYIGVRSGRGVGNTNAGTVTFTYDDWASTSYIPIADGATSKWTPDRDEGYDPDTHVGGDAWTDIEINGPSERANSSKAALSAIRRSMLAASPDAYWPLEDPEGTTAPLSGLQGGTPGQIESGTPTFGNTPDGLVSASVSLVKSWTTAEDGVIFLPLEGFPDGSIQVECVAGAPAGRSADFVVEVVTTSNDHWFATTFGLSTSDGLLHHCALQAVENGANVDYELFVDGITTSAFSIAGDVGTPIGIRIGGGISSGGAAGSAMYVGHVAAWSAFVEPSGRGLCGVGYLGESAPDRFMRLCQEHGIAGGVSGDLTLGANGMGVQQVDSLANLFVECASTDMGMVADGRAWHGLEFRTGRSLSNQTPALELTYGVNVAPPLKPVADLLGIANDITATSPDGNTAHASKDSGPLNTSDPIDDPEGINQVEGSVSANPELPSGLADIAGWTLLTSTDPGSRYQSVTIDLSKHPELLDACMNLRMGDLITIDELDADLVELLVLGGEHALVSYHHRLTLNCTPAGSYRVATVGNTSELSRIGSSSSSLAADFDAGSDTSMSVAVTGTLWSTSASGFHIRVGGVVLNVTAVSGSSSPQTFTVDATPVNGIERTLLASDPIALTRIELEHPVYVGA